MVGQASIPPPRAEAHLSFRFDPQISLIATVSLGPNVCTWCPRKGKGGRRDERTPQRTDGWLLHPTPLHPHRRSPQGWALLTKRGFANTTLDKHSCTCSFWHLFIVKDNLTWMAGETAHLLLKIGFVSFSQQSACAEWCFKNIPRHSANTEAFPYPAGQG